MDCVGGAGVVQYQQALPGVSQGKLDEGVSEETTEQIKVRPMPMPSDLISSAIAQECAMHSRMRNCA